MTDHRKLWEQMKKLPGGDSDPFETPVGPTEECLSSRQIVSYVKNDKNDFDTLRHLMDCEACRERVERFKRVI